MKYVFLNTITTRKPFYTLRVVPTSKSGVSLIFFVCLVSERPLQQQGYIADGSQDRRLTLLRGATHETEWGDHEFCLSRSHYTDTTQPVGSERPQWESNPQSPQ